MTSRGQRGRGRGRGSNPRYDPSEYPPLSRGGGQTSNPTARDVLLRPEDPYTPNSLSDETVLWIEPSDEQWMTDPWEIKRRYLTTQQSPPHFDQYRYIYEQILVETGAVEIKHTLHDANKTASPIQFSKMVIRNIMPIATWGIHPHTTRDIDLRNKQTKYSYWDYIDAFTQVFYYQNPIKNHSWFIRITSDVLKTDVPSWFLVWWDKFGLSLDILPESVRTEFDEWHVAYSRAYSYLNKNRELSIRKAIVHFSIRFSIPWIWKWDFACDYQNKIPRLKRIYFIKWWDKMDLKDLIPKIQQHTKACWDSVKQPALSPAPSSPVTNPFVQMQKELKQKFPNLSDNELILKSMDYLKEQFLQSVNPEDDTSMRSGTSHTQSESEADPADHVLAGESQSEDEAEVTLGDFWDSFTAAIADKMAQDKGNKGKGPEL